MRDASGSPRVLLCTTTTGYQTRMFDEAAGRLGVELLVASDRCDQLDDPWRDRAVPVRFHDEAGALAAIAQRLGDGRLDGVLAVGDRPAVLAALVAGQHALPWHSVAGTRAGRDKRVFRAAQRAAGLPAPWTVTVDAADAAVPEGVTYPCVVKPLVLSGSRGVIRADTPADLRAAMARVAAILEAPDVRELRDEAASRLLIEGYIEGDELAVEGIMERGTFHPLAVFDKPDPLVGPFFEETIYVTPTDRSRASAAAAVAAVTEAALAAGLWHGPVHAECRVSSSGVVVLEAAARPIGGLCARVVECETADGGIYPLEHHLLVHALGGGVPAAAAPGATGVMMVPIPQAGILRGVDGVEAARAVPHVSDVVVTAKAGQLLQPIPEGASYLAFVFARARTSDGVLAALRAAHACLRFSIAAVLPMRRGER